MLGNRTSEDWIKEYAAGHQNKINRLCHTFGIPMILLSLVLFAVSIFASALLKLAAVLFLFGWVLQFVGHAFEGQKPEFFKDWRFLFVGVRWWYAKIRGKA